MLLLKIMAILLVVIVSYLISPPTGIMFTFAVVVGIIIGVTRWVRESDDGTRSVYTFDNPFDTDEEAADAIEQAVLSIKGKVRRNGNVIEARWRSPRFMTIFAQRFVFTVGSSTVTVLGPKSPECIFISVKCQGFLNIWNDFVVALTGLYSDSDFNLLTGDYHIVEAIIDDAEGEHHYIESPSRDNDSTSDSRIYSGITAFSVKERVNITVRYSNGAIKEESSPKGSDVYRHITANLTEIK